MVIGKSLPWSCLVGANWTFYILEPQIANLTQLQIEDPEILLIKTTPAPSRLLFYLFIFLKRHHSPQPAMGRGGTTSQIW